MSNNDIEPATLAQRLDDKDDLFLLDVRNEADYEEWQIEDSTNIPIYDELLEHDFSTLESRLEDLPSKQEIVTICVAGITSARAAEFLRDQGFDAKSVDDGMNGGGASIASTTSMRLTASFRSSARELAVSRISSSMPARPSSSIRASTSTST